MRRALQLLLVVALGALSARAEGPSALEAALDAELSRAMQGLALPNQPKPYWIQTEVLDGDVATARASFGALHADDHDPYRNLRAEVRVGSYALDSSNFVGGIGGRDGVMNRTLPLEDAPDALRREVWLALDEAYKGATETYAAKLAARQGQDRERPPDFSRATPLVGAPLPPAKADADVVRGWARALSAALAEFPELEVGTAVARDWQGTRLLISSEGTRAWLPTGFAVVVVQATARAPDGAVLRDARWWVARRPDRMPSEAEMLAEVRAMGRSLVQRRDAPVLEDYLGPVLFEQAAAVELFRQLLPAELSGTPPIESAPDAFGDAPEQRGTARLGRRLLPDGWSVVDDPTLLPDEAGSYRHDFEGVPAERVELVADGVVRDLLMSRIPRADRARSNGHGRALGVDRRAALPGLVVVEPPRARSTRALERAALKLARQAGQPWALVVSRVLPPSLTESFEVAFSGDAPLSGLTPPVEAYRLWPDGRREPVRGLSFVGVDRRALRDIVAAGEAGPPTGVLDAAPDSGRFNLGEVGGLPVTWVVPPVLLSELELHGAGGGEPRVIPPP